MHFLLLQVSVTDVEKLKKSHKLDGFRETSAKEEQEALKEVFHSAIRLALGNKSLYQIEVSD